MRRIFLLISAVLSLIVLGVLIRGLVSGRTDPQPANGAALVAVTVPALNAETRAGEALFAKNCAVCHGDNAAGRDGFGPPLVHRIYEPGHHGDGAFHLAAARGVRAHHWPFGDMLPVENVRQRDLERIVAYVRALQRANGIN
ncbi:c-type cytochrome [Roseibium marinum]|uniref:Cbb3-type cytochrome c oxidase subunit III n=1 Tax=Roseibium marinum TaxID=281252 RepID=A0A2S3V2T6_9HYPH|nr:cytochrome c [Roseibium marinum]POF34291.1 cbb3-type cytochrome c oxidase subunit III [Roseibium marinum]